MLALVLAIGGILIGWSEAPWNHHAWGLTAANLILALSIWIDARGRRQRLLAGSDEHVDPSRSSRINPSSSPAADNSGA
ncbi:MAG: hypothetical protein HC826_02470 [Rhodospirillales bacterium]|nr:hypothetical protein [Rhodospirillales bacterium]